MIDPSLALVLQAALIGLPLLGNCIALGRRGAAVLLAARRDDRIITHGGGDCFAVRAFPLAPPLVFVFHPRAVASFFAAPEETLSFKPAVRRFTERVFGLPAEEFSASHEPLLDALRALLAPPERLRAHAAEIAARAAPLLDQWAADCDADADNGAAPPPPFDLWPRARTLVFQAAGAALFGDAFFARHGAASLERLFLDFEGGFERAASPLPHALLPRFRAGRRYLLRALSESLEKGDLEGTVAGELAARSGVRPGLRPSLLLSVLWASQANSMPAFFWALAFLLQPENAAWLERVRDAAAGGRGAGGAGGGAGGGDGAGAGAGLLCRRLRGEIEAALDPSGPAQRVANESIRARAHSIAVRLVPPRSKGFDVPVAAADAADAAAAVRVPAGSVLAVCPFETHADARLFSPRPLEFDPSRPATGALPGGGGVGMGFGGGFWRCPGRLFAGMELGLLLSMAVTRLDLRVVVGGGGQGRAGGEKGEKGEEEALCWWERAAVALLGEPRARYGLGVGLGGGTSSSLASPVCPSLRPPADLMRLVGFKVPAAPLMVIARRRKGRE